MIKLFFLIETIFYFYLLQTIVDDWIEKYKSNRENALLMLMQFFINGSGCKGRITPEMQTTMEHVAIIRKMTEEFDEVIFSIKITMLNEMYTEFKYEFPCLYFDSLIL